MYLIRWLMDTVRWLPLLATEHIIGYMLKTVCLTPQVTLSWLYTLPAKRSHVTSVGPCCCTKLDLP